MKTSEQITAWYAQHDEMEDEGLPAFFNGIEGLRFLGMADCHATVDGLLYANRLSTEKISTVEVNSTKQRAYIAHN